MKSLFSGLTSLSLRFRAVTLALVVLVSIGGVIGVTQMKQELIPSIEFPQTIILAQATGMSSEQVLNVITTRIEEALDEIDQVVNLESQTTGAFGAVITARSDFGNDQSRVRAEIARAIDSVWLPARRLQAADGEEPQAFARRLLADLPADVLIYLHESDGNFLFQISPEVWNALSPDTVRTVLAYLAAQTNELDGNPLRQLVEHEVLPILENIPQVASVTVAGGQLLPGEGENDAAAAAQTVQESLLLQLTPEAWAAASAKVEGLTTLDQNAVETLRDVEVEIPEGVPALPQSWHMDRFKDARDLTELRTLTRSTGAVFNSFVNNGVIVGALGQTDDLTPEDVTRLLAIEPTLVEAFEADQLVAMSDEVFAVIPEEFIADLDGFTRDELAAKALARAISGEEVDPAPVDLPQSWRIQPPQLITFSFDDLPLATFSIAGTAPSSAPAAEAPAEGDSVPTPEAEPAEGDQPAARDIPEGPRLPLAFSLIGTFIGLELNSADDLIDVQLPEDLAAQFGGGELDAAQLLNFLLLLDNPDALPEGAPSLSIPGGAAGLIRGLSADAISFIAEHDPDFLPALSAEVYDAFSNDVLALPNVAPPLDSVWNALSNQPQFDETPLAGAQDIVDIGGGQPSRVLNTINENVPEQFAGYEVRLFDSLTPGIIRFFMLREPDFFSSLASDVLTKFAPETIAMIPEEALAALPEGVSAELRAIASGEAPSAAEQLAALYTTDVPPADPNAPALSSDWQFIGDFIGAELDTADDLFRFYSGASSFINGLFTSAQGASFAPNLIGSLSPEAVAYIVEREPGFFSDLRPEAMSMFAPEVVATLPAEVQEQIATGAEPFTPTAAVTRLNGSSSLTVTVYKTDDANNVEAYHIVEDALHAIDEANQNITVGVAFEQASFTEESISGVARAGGLGAVFAGIVILVFLSSGVWSRRPRQIAGAVLIVLFLGALLLLVMSNLGAAGGDFNRAFEMTDTVVRVLLIIGMVVGFVVLLYPGNIAYPAWRCTLVTGVSIPLSVLIAFAAMNWMSPLIHGWLAPLAADSPLVAFILRLFPESITLNIMTLSGLTVAIGRVVDDSIVVLENIFRHVQEGENKRRAIIEGTRDVSVAIFAATVITVVVFLPLGLTGGIIGEFFLPFGLAVTYALVSSFIVAVTVVPVMAYLLLDQREISEEEHTWLERLYLPLLRWSLARGSHRAIVLGIAGLSLLVGLALFASRPMAFLPAFGEPQIGVSVSLPAGTKMVETDELIREFEAYIKSDLPQQDVTAVQTTIGSGGGLETMILGSSGVSENIATISIGVSDQSRLDALTQEVRVAAERIFGQDHVTVSGASLSEQGLGGFALVLSGPQEDLIAVNDRVIETLNGVEGLANAASSFGALGTGGEAADAPATYIRVDRASAVRFTAELETENTLGVTSAAKSAILAMPDLPQTVAVSEGFETQMQTEGFASLGTAMGIAVVLVVLILIVTFGSVVHWLDIILSIIVAPVGAAVLLALTNRVLGISAMIGLLMLIGIVVTNAVVLIDRVQSNRRERHMSVHDALVEAGGRRLRPILMTALATIGALIPLAIGLSKGAIIAAELGTVVIGGLFSSTLLTLIVVPVAYILLDPIHRRFSLSREKAQEQQPSKAEV